MQVASSFSHTSLSYWVLFLSGFHLFVVLCLRVQNLIDFPKNIKICQKKSAKDFFFPLFIFGLVDLKSGSFIEYDY